MQIDRIGLKTSQFFRHSFWKTFCKMKFEREQRFQSQKIGTRNLFSSKHNKNQPKIETKNEEIFPK